MAVIILAGCKGSSSSEGERWDVTASAEFGRIPRWSPLGNEIIFGDDTPGRSGIFLWHPGSDPVLLVDSLPPHNWDYRWSPDGLRVAFTSPGEPDVDTSTGIWIIDVSGDSAMHVFDRGRDLSWRFGGDSVAVRIDQPASGAPGIYSVDLLSRLASLVKEGGFKPSCSPKSAWLAYSDGEINGKLHIIGSAPDRIVTTNGALQWEWSADGKTLYAIVNDYLSGTIRGDLWRINVAGDSAKVDTALASYAAFPAPNRDGSQVAIQRASGPRWVGVWIYRSGGEEIEINDFGENPSYDPTGDRIAVNMPGGGIRVLTRSK